MCDINVFVFLLSYLYFLPALHDWGGVGWEFELVSGTRRQYCSGLMLNKCLIKPPLHGVQHKCLINVGLRTNKSDKAAVYSRYGSHICSSAHLYTSSSAPRRPLSETIPETTLRDYSRYICDIYALQDAPIHIHQYTPVGSGMGHNICSTHLPLRD